MKTMRKVLALCLGIMMLFSSLEGLPEAVAEVIEMTTETPAPVTGESGGSTEPQQEQQSAPTGGVA